ncbi:MAG TPA: GtrA family protein [Casimicrobiaceae bacterium]
MSARAFARSVPRQPVARRRELVAYVAVSALALGVDIVTLYLLAVQLGMNKALAAAVGYAAGLVAHYALAISRVFVFRRFGNRPRLEFALYAWTGLLGVASSYLVVLAGTASGLSLPLSKAVAVVVSFALTFLARRHLLFR